MLDFLLSALAIGGLALRVFMGCSAKTSADAFSDLKTLYASAWCFAHGLNAYSIENIRTVFARQGIVEPASWYGHAPVYPPTTLALLAPFCALPITTAMYAITGISLLAFICAVVRLLQASSDESGMRWGWKAILVTACASGPLLGSALICGNLSVLASALAIFAFTTVKTKHSWLPAVSLALAVCLKPHLGIWIVIAMLLLPQKPYRAIAVRAAAAGTVLCGAVALLMAAQGTLIMQVRGLISMMSLEASAGSSMSASSREVLPIEFQITSLQSLLGFWHADHLLCLVITIVVLCIAGWWLVGATLRAQKEEEAILAAGAWVAFGMLATYHRAHDAIALLVLVPYLMKRLRSTPEDLKVWTVIALYVATSFGPSMGSITYRVMTSTQHSMLPFVMLRQASIADLGLMVMLLLTLRDENLRHTGFVTEEDERFSMLGRMYGRLRAAGSVAAASIASKGGVS